MIQSIQTPTAQGQSVPRASADDPLVPTLAEIPAASYMQKIGTVFDFIEEL
jgi:hypothetical protein